MASQSKAAWSVTLGVATALGLALAGCHQDATEPTSRKPPYIAIVVKAETAFLDEPGVRYTYRIKGLSTGSTYDTLVTVAPSDTVIVSVSEGTYQVSLSNLPEKCVSRYGLVQEVVVPPNTNTAIVRYFVGCNMPLAVRVYTAGLPVDPEFIWEIARKGGGSVETGIVRHREENLFFPTLPPGDYVVSLWNAPEPCVFTNNGGRHQAVTIPPNGGTRIGFSVVCSQVAKRPKLIDFTWSTADSVIGFIATAEDPDFNIALYYFDITDCDGTSILPGGARERGGLHLGRTAYQLRPTIIGAFELGIPPEALVGRCGSLRIQDLDGNTTPTVEKLAGSPVGASPEAISFNAVFRSDVLLGTDLAAHDRDEDFFGTFVAARLRDGTLGPQDGKPDIGIYNSAGYEGTTIPDLPLGGRILYTDVYAVMVYLFDRQGHFRRYVDEDTFH